MTEPTAPIELTGTATRWTDPTFQPDDTLISQLSEICETITSEAATAEASRDWWPLAMHWSLTGAVPQRAAAMCRPTDVGQVAAVLAACSANRIPVTPAAGRSGVSGATVPVFGGVILDLTAMQGIVDVDAPSGVVEVLAGTFGPDLEAELRQRNAMTVGHFPQSFDIATVGGWVACRGAGQFSTRYGKIDEMVVGLEVVLADGRNSHRPGRLQRWADLTRLFLRKRRHARRDHSRVASCPSVPTHGDGRNTDFETGIEACRLILRRG